MILSLPDARWACEIRVDRLIVHPMGLNLARSLEFLLNLRALFFLSVNLSDFLGQGQQFADGFYTVSCFVNETDVYSYIRYPASSFKKFS